MQVINQTIRMEHGEVITLVLPTGEEIQIGTGGPKAKDNRPFVAVTIQDGYHAEQIYQVEFDLKLKQKTVAVLNEFFKLT